jgi:PKHD-type hydroxylase
VLVHVPKLLSAEEVVAFRQALESANWVDGAESAGAQARSVKRNTQLPQDSPIRIDLANRVMQAISRNTLFNAAALPQRISVPMFSRYEPGMAFGPHIDNAIRGGTTLEPPMRTDLSATLFLSPRDEYDGGELIVPTDFGHQAVKLEAGDAILYPSTTVHQVNPIRRGVRLASFFWIQSMVSDGGQRELLFQMDMAITGVRQTLPPADPSILSLTACFHNLLRMWAKV